MGGRPPPPMGYPSERWLQRLQAEDRNWLIVLTGSMVPLIHPGDRVCVRAVGAERLRSGDIVVFRRNGSLVVHRHLGAFPGGDGHLECGDSHGMLGRFEAADLIGRISHVCKAAGTMVALEAAPWPRLNLVLGRSGLLLLSRSGVSGRRRRLWRWWLGQLMQHWGGLGPTG